MLYQLLNLFFAVRLRDLYSLPLSSFFINDLLLPLNSQVHAYANDITFYISDSNLSQLHNLTADIAMIEQWCTYNHLVINTFKSHFLAIDYTAPSSKFSILGDLLSKRPTSKLLGFTIVMPITKQIYLETINTKNTHAHENHVLQELQATVRKPK